MQFNNFLTKKLQIFPFRTSIVNKLKSIIKKNGFFKMG